MTRRGLLLINLGTPDAPDTASVGRYLRQFLADPRVIDIPTLPRWFLVNVVIVPFRAAKSAHAYRAVWTDEGSPLLWHTRALQRAVAQQLGDAWVVELGMRYGNPSIAAAVESLCTQSVERIVVLPLFPQYASATTGSALEELYKVLARRTVVPSVSVCTPFFDDAGYVAALAAVTSAAISDFEPDMTVFSYHGLPVRQIMRVHEAGVTCDAVTPCEAPREQTRHCYRAQCYATSRAVAVGLRLPAERYVTSFQSRLGRTPWIRPYTDDVLRDLRQRGVRRLAMLSPAFTADCLETIEELGIRARDTWKRLGGEDMRLVPCLNEHPRWVSAVADLVRATANN